MPVHKQILRSRPSAWETGSGSSQVTISEESLEGSLPLEQQDEKYPVGTAVTKVRELLFSDLHDVALC